MRTVKQVIIMRTDLNMRKGKMVAQGSHAAMAFLTRYGPFSLIKGLWCFFMDRAFRQWVSGPFTKICVGVDSEADLLYYFRYAKSLGLRAHLITDSGKTEFDGRPTNTCCAIGPNWSDEIDKVTKFLDLL